MRAIILLFSWVFATNVCSAQTAKGVRLLCNWRDTAASPGNGRGQYWNDVWGFVANGKEYAAIGGTAGTHIIDVSECNAVAFLPGRSQGVSHRDYKTYGHYLYGVSDQGAATLQVWDFSKLPREMPLVWESDVRDLRTSHTIFIDTAKARLYCASANNASTGHDDIRIYSLADPKKPVFIRAINEFENTHALYARNDTAWCSNGHGGYLMLDMSKLPSYRIIGGLFTYPHQGYNHSSWIGPDGIGVMADETFGKPMKVIDTRTPGRRIEVLSTFSPRGTDSTSVPHNPYLLGHYAIISYYMDGLQIYDISDPRAPVQSGYYDTYKGANVQTYAGAWGCYPFLPSRRILVSDMQTGLYVFDADEALGIRKDSGLLLFPNPTEGTLLVRLPAGIGGTAAISIWNVSGMVMHRFETVVDPEANADLRVSLPPATPAGVYFLRVVVGGQVFSARFIKR